MEKDQEQTRDTPPQEQEQSKEEEELDLFESLFRVRVRMAPNRNPEEDPSS